MSEFIVKVSIYPPGQIENAFARTTQVNYNDPSRLETKAHAFINGVKLEGDPKDAPLHGEVHDGD